MDSRPIGFFDSGVGGLSILAEVRALLPAERLIYVGDSGHFPYGAIAPETLCELTSALTRFLLEKQAKLIVVACNTATVYALAHLRATFPGVPFVGVVPVIKVLAEHTRTGTIGLLSSPNTARSDYLTGLIERFAADKTVVNIPCDGLADLVESGEFAGPSLDGRLRAYLQPIMSSRADVLGLGCTHYPFLRPQIEAMLGDRVRVFDSNLPVALHVRSLLSGKNALGAHTTPMHEFYTTGDRSVFSFVAARLPGVPDEAAAVADLSIALPALAAD